MRYIYTNIFVIYIIQLSIRKFYLLNLATRDLSRENIYNPMLFPSKKWNTYSPIIFYPVSRNMVSIVPFCKMQIGHDTTTKAATRQKETRYYIAFWCRYLLQTLTRLLQVKSKILQSKK